ncbi:MAG: FAD-dependent oxidoreductase, partial [Clostridia bacterium]|nr:FAD-dependent oxidoreductase [Clostridia bacterium]
IGTGPAGISAALYTLRAGLTTALFDTGESGLCKAERIDNYYGFPGGISGAALLAAGREQAAALGAHLFAEEVVRIEGIDGIRVHTADRLYTASALLLATGARRQSAPVPGLRELEGKGVSACAICDGFFHRGKPVAVLGSGAFAAAEARELVPLAAEVTVLTNGETPTADFGNLPLLTTPLARVEGEERLTGVLLEDGTRLALSGLFLAVGKASAVSLALPAGILTGPDGITVDRQMRTNLPGVFAAGDCTGGLLQIAKAAGEGAVAGTEMVTWVRKKA